MTLKKNQLSRPSETKNRKQRPQFRRRDAVVCGVRVVTLVRQLSVAAQDTDHRCWVNARHEELNACPTGATPDDIEMLFRELAIRWARLRIRALDDVGHNWVDAQWVDLYYGGSAQGALADYLRNAVNDLISAVNLLEKGRVDKALEQLRYHEMEMGLARAVGDFLRLYWRSCPKPVENDAPSPAPGRPDVEEVYGALERI
jgi:hypothetical protein